MREYSLVESAFENIIFIEPQGYMDNLSYLYHSDGLVTDSGGMQKEAYWLKKNCITIRTETEWTETLKNGWNTLMFNDLSGMGEALGTVNTEYLELYGDSDAAGKITSILLQVSKK
jgi:UDP-N-acetylglucosamine 2-epimerase